MAKQEQNLIKLDEFNIQQLPELQNKKQEVSAKLEQFKYVEIKDNATYEEAKKSRTGARTLRTDLQKEQKAVEKKIKDHVLVPVKTAYDELIDTVLPIENKQQDEVSRWEEIKEQERQEKLLLEIKRVESIKAKINAYKTKWEDLISQLFFSEIDNLKAKLFEENEAFDRKSLEEFEILFDDVLISLGSSLYSKIDLLTKEEELRLEREGLAQIQAEQNRVNAIKTKIDSWEKNWLYVINNLEFRNISVTHNEFETQIALDCQELQSEYAEKRNQIQELLSAKVSQLKEAEDQRIERENFLKEKAEFEAKQVEAKFQERKKFLIDEDYWRIYLLAECGESEWTAENNLKNFSDSEFEDFKLAILKSKELVSVIGEEIIKEEEPIKVDENSTSEEIPQQFTTEDFDFNKGVAESIEKVIPSKEIVSEEKQKSYDVSVMTYDDKLTLLISWIEKMDEVGLDGLIEEYFNN
jgi:hypothetical protein